MPVTSINTKFIFLLAGALLQFSLQAQMKFTAKVVPAVIEKNGIAELKLIVENAAEVRQIVPPSLKDFIIISGPSRETGTEEITKGITKPYTGITFQIKPRAKGLFTISSATAQADGMLLKSNEVLLTVTDNANFSTANNSQGISLFNEPETSTFEDFVLRKNENVKEKIGQNIFIKVDADKTACYVGEPVVVTYKLYTRLKSESNITKSPSFNGFSVVDLLQAGNTFYKTEKLRGRLYNVYTLRKSQLYPLQAGKIELESAEIENNIRFIKQEYISKNDNIGDDFFGGVSRKLMPVEAFVNDTITLKSNPIFITVKPLPEEKKPISFNGAVGNFIITASVDKDSFSTDDAAVLKVTLAGQGNLTLVTLPEIIWPQGVESFEPKTTNELNKLVVPVSGSKMFEYNFSISKPGNYELPGIEFSYFDVAAKMYKTVFTKPILFNVSKGADKKPMPSFPIEKKSEQTFFLDTIFTHRWILVIPIALLISGGLFFWWRHDRKKITAVAIVETVIAINNTKEQTHSLRNENIFHQAADKLQTQDSKGFYKALDTVLKSFVSQNLHLPIENLSKKSIADAMEQKNISLQTISNVLQLLDDIEWQLYTPIANESKMEIIYEQANLVVKALTNVSS